jgi:hypothetical protein
MNAVTLPDGDARSCVCWCAHAFVQGSVRFSVMCPNDATMPEFNLRGQIVQVELASTDSIASIKDQLQVSGHGTQQQRLSVGLWWRVASVCVCVLPVRGVRLDALTAPPQALAIRVARRALPRRRP